MKKPEEVSSRVAETSLGSGWELDDSGFVTLLKDLSNDEGRACDCKGFSFLIFEDGYVQVPDGSYKSEPAFIQV